MDNRKNIDDNMYLGMCNSLLNLFNQKNMMNKNFIIYLIQVVISSQDEVHEWITGSNAWITHRDEWIANNS